ncbi:serine hydrolase [Candidatus Omnitrophota bacterium]
MKKYTATTVMLLTLLSIVLPQTASGETTAWDETYIKSILEEHVDIDKTNVSMVIGVIDETGSKVFSRGTRLKNGFGGAVNGDTVYEIGSITKVFTSLVLADMVKRGEVKLDDPVQYYLPESVVAPQKNNKEISLLHLSTHMSGLPREVDNMQPGDWRNPYENYSEELLFEFLNNHTLSRDPGSEFEYSNLGAGLLGYALSLHAEMDYEDMVIDRISNVLNMNDTRITMTKEQTNRSATPYNKDGYPTLRVDIGILDGCGEMRSTVNDLLKFLAVNLGYQETDLSVTVMKTHIEQVNLYDRILGIGLAWLIHNDLGVEVIEHSGSTLGFNSFIGFVKEKGIGVVVLSNSTHNIGDIGMHLLDSRYELTSHHTEISVSSEILDTYTGMYKLAPGVYVTVDRTGSGLFVQFTGDNRYQVYPETETYFFYKVDNAQITFVKGDDESTSHMVLHQGVQDYDIIKLGFAKETPISSGILKTYAGEYRDSGGTVCTVTLESDQLYLQRSDSHPAMLAAVTLNEFYDESGNFLVLFNAGDSGQAGLTIYQGGSAETFQKSSDPSAVSDNLPDGFSLAQNSPNPFNPSTTISYSLPKESTVTLSVYTITGQEVIVFENGIQSAGNHTVIWNANNMPSGVYFYRLCAGTFAETKRMLLVK